MTAQILNGKLYSIKIRKKIKRDVEHLKLNHDLVPGLVVIIVGENPASEIYIASKHKACEEIGIYSEVLRLAASTTREELLQQINKYNKDSRIHGILVQLPLPETLKPYEKEVLDYINPDKDVDGFHPVNVGRLSIGIERLVPCTPNGCIKMLEMAEISIAGKNAVVVGRSNIVGKPMAMLLLSRDATVTICHSQTKNLAEITSKADILVVAVGTPGFITKDMVKPGATVIDVGINRLADKKVVGDIAFDEVKEVAGAITPVPGGIGLLTIAMLLDNTVRSTRYLNGVDK